MSLRLLLLSKVCSISTSDLFLNFMPRSRQNQSPPPPSPATRLDADEKRFMDAVRVIQEGSLSHGFLPNIRIEGLQRFLAEATSPDAHWFVQTANSRLPADRQLSRLVKQIIEGPADLARSNASHIAFLTLGALADNETPHQPFEPIFDARTSRQHCKVIESLVLMVDKRTTNHFHAGHHRMPKAVEAAAMHYFNRPASHDMAGFSIVGMMMLNTEGGYFAC